jgi:hypothetical protein
MSQFPNINGTSGGSQKAFGDRTSLNDVNVDDFLKLMIAELQNQDPLNPLENSELVAQISQIRSVGATDKLTSTLDSVLLGQNISSATNLIGADIDAISDDNQRVSGLVERVSVAGGVPKLHLDLNPKARASTDEGNVDAGKYEYRVVWEDGGNLYGVDPLTKSGGSITVTGEPGVDAAIEITNLPETTGSKQVYRREFGTEQFRLAGTIVDRKASSFVDAKSNAELSATVLNGAPQLVEPRRQFEVSLKNVGEIRPPSRVVQE